MTLISQMQIFWNVIYMEYINHKWDILWISYSSPPRAPPALGALRRLRVRVSWPRLAPPCFTAMRRSSLSATDRFPRRGLPRPNCHSHLLISYTLLPFLPDSSAASASPCGNLLLRCWRSWCGMVGVELPRRNKGIKGTLPSTLVTRPT